MKLEIEEISKLASETTEGEPTQYFQVTSQSAQEELRRTFQEFERSHAEAAARLQDLSAG